jgi:hypothetical protein
LADRAAAGAAESKCSALFEIFHPDHHRPAFDDRQPVFIKLN